MARKFHEVTVLGLSRKLPISYLSPKLQIANFSILGDVDLCEAVGVDFETYLKKNKIKPDCFVSPQLKIVPLVHHMAKRYNQSRYVILRKSVRGYMISPIVEHPWHKAPKHVKKLVLNGSDQEHLKNKTVVVIDDVVSTGVTINMTTELMERIGARVLFKLCVFKQGDESVKSLYSVSSLPLIRSSNKEPI